MLVKHRITSRDIHEHVGKTVRVSGWLHAVRRLGGIHFVLVRDGWGLIQAVGHDESTLRPLSTSNASSESIIAVEGEVFSANAAPNGVELRNPHIEVLIPIAEPPPLVLGKRELKATLPTLLEHAIVGNRHPTRRAVFRMGSVMIEAFRRALSARSFTEIQTPKIVASATEGGANVFRLDYFGRSAYLAQSPQFYKQIMVGVFERVFEVGPVFRAEPHDTTRHVNEYVSMDAEMGFIDDHFTVMIVLRDVLANIVSALRENCAADLALLGIRLPDVPANIPHIHFAKAKQLFAQPAAPDGGGTDLSPDEEKAIGTWAKSEHDSDFIFVTGYPMAKRPFYTHPDPERPEFSNSFDLLFRGLELVTGGQRLHLYDDYMTALAKADMPVKPFTSYLEAFRYGMPRHGGFAIGVERFLMQLTGATNIRSVTLFPRDLNRLSP